MFNPSPPAPQQWALAATAILTTMTRRAPRHDCLGGAPQGPDSQGTAKTILLNSWGIESRQKLESTLEWLSTGGHSMDYRAAATAFGQASAQQRQADPKLAFVGQYGAQLGDRGLLAWDLGRLLAVAGWGYLAGFCSDVEAWGLILPAAERLRAAYTSWDEYGQHYRLGCLFWNADAVTQLDSILGQLRSAPDSPWRTVAWVLNVAPGGAIPYGATPAASAYGGVPVIAPPPGGGAAPPAGAAPYGAALGAVAYGGVPVVAPPPGGAAPPPGLSPYGGAPGAPYGGSPIIHPSASGVGGRAAGKTKTLLLLVGLGVGLLLLVSILVGIWHFTHESHEREHESHEKHRR